MKVRLTFLADDKIVLKKGYFSSVQGLIYNLLDEVSRNWLHEEGFRYKKRFFKLFVFSEIMEKGVLSRSKNEFLFPRKISIFVASPVNWILEQVVKNGIMEEYLTLGENKVRLIEVETGKDPDISEGKVEIRTLSPIEVHSTLSHLKDTARKKTYFYNPTEEEFSLLINENLKKKWEVFYKEVCPYNLKIFPSDDGKFKKRVIILKNNPINGWKGRFYLEGDIPLMKFAFNVGLGSHNSLGFGFIEKIERRRK